MSTVISADQIQREPELLGQTIVVIGGSARIGFETAQRASAEGAKVIFTARNPKNLECAASEVDALSAAAFDATDVKLLETNTALTGATYDLDGRQQLVAA